MHIYIFILAVFIYLSNDIVSGNMLEFPKDFIFGVASAAYQIEGAHNADGKGENIWDYHLSKNPDLVSDKSNGNIACDSYNKLDDDLKALEDLGVNFYRFSISWTRILPNGRTNHINEKGVEYYNKLIDGLLERNIQPMVTIYHWDLPITLQELGGWSNELMTDYYEDYARILFEKFGDRVKYWITFNCNWLGYGDNFMPPFINQPGIANYLYVKNVLLAHAKAYHLYNKHFRESQNGKIGITIDGRWSEPASSKDIEATERLRQLTIGIYVHPLVKGDFPELIKNRIGNLSKEEGFPKSRLPELSQQQIDYIKNSYDFLGFNIYTTFLIKEYKVDSLTPSHDRDAAVKLLQSPEWPKSASDWLRSVPWGARKVLNWIKEEYNNPEIIITENGISDLGEIEDKNRINFYYSYLKAILEAIYEDKVNVKGYAVWSLLDNFEWISGYTQKFGLYHVDFEDPSRPRTPKTSARWYKHLIKTRKLASIDEVKDEL